MKELRQTLDFIFPIAAMFIGFLLIIAAFNVTVSGYFYKMSRDALAFISGSFLIALGALYFIIRFKFSADSERISLVGKEGASVTVGAIEDFVRRTAADIPAITDIAPRVVPSGDGIRIIVNVALKQPVPIPPLAQSVSEKIRVALQADLGIEKVEAVELNVTKILTTQPPQT